MNRAPDPTQRGKRGISTFNIKHTQSLSSSQRFSRSIKDISKNEIIIEDSKGAQKKSTLNLIAGKSKKTKSPRLKIGRKLLKPKPTSSETSVKGAARQKSTSFRGTMPRKMKNLLKGYYTKKVNTFVEASDVEIDILRTEEELKSEAEKDVSKKNNVKFKEAMLKKYGNGIGTYGFSSDNFEISKRRRDSSFSAENSLVLLLGRSKAGKSTIFKQLLTLSGAPPNYARAYIATKIPEEREISIENADMTLVDVGGSSNDIVDWRFYLTSAEVIIFVVALDEFDKVLPRKDSGENQKPYTGLLESLELFDSIVNNVALLNSRFILVLNKRDRFKKKIEKRGISLASIGCYDGALSSFDTKQSVEYIEDLFLERADESEHDIEVEVTSAIDGDQCNSMLTRLTQQLVKSKDVTKWKNLL